MLKIRDKSGKTKFVLSDSDDEPVKVNGDKLIVEDDKKDESKKEKK